MSRLSRVPVVSGFALCGVSGMAGACEVMQEWRLWQTRAGDSGTGARLRWLRDFGQVVAATMGD